MTEVRVNEVGDMVLTEAAAMRALAQPVRLALMDQLTRQGAATTDELGSAVDVSTDEAAEHLGELAAVGLVRAIDDGWEACGRGLFFEIPEDGPVDVQEAARALSSAMLLSYEHVPREWVEDTEPALDVDWARSAGLFNAGMWLTAAELRKVQEDLETLLMPYLQRTGPTEDARRVRMLAYFLPPTTDS
ncbi:helix-turn-helix transcriptional regulator [Kribbella sandramycini]|uniref:DNA-binding transcriptional ArsR family regulator n=1 Tax=Kribbella sandramycini TaxID=60450 RepID=A0A7Y4KU50_9ACTN|nr:helix-turn-helix domain-containing protein [Kribbella sandramycini]MBB6568654.1 DNA-binding transcriptional ArsR family regulator [Kribbella sandramycini]NOL38760.1 helix-turn-helix transcriptional regulator [Kribbella sandramycini]